MVVTLLSVRNALPIIVNYPITSNLVYGTKASGM